MKNKKAELQMELGDVAVFVLHSEKYSDRNIRDSCEFQPNLIEEKFFIRQNLPSKDFLNQ